jgi:molecular chaperone DnaJ
MTAPMLDGNEQVDVPPGTQPGTVFRLRGKGMPSLNSASKGDLHVMVKLVVPADLTAHQRELLREFAVERDENVEQKSKSVFQKVKDVFGE